MAQNLNLSTTTGIKPDAYYDRMLLEMIRQTEFKHARYAVEKTLKKNFGDTINWRRYNALTVNKTPLTEGVTPDGRTISGAEVTCVIYQYGDVIWLSDRVSNEYLDDVKTEYTMELGDLAKQTLDEITRDVLLATPSKAYAGTATSVATLDDTMVPTIDDFRKIALGMKTSHIKGNQKANGRYVCLCSAEVIYDLMDDTKLEKYMDYGNTNRPLVDNMVADIYDLRFVEVLNAGVIADSGVGGAHNVHRSLVLGKKAYAKTKLSGQSVQIISKGLGSAGTEDALNQRQSIGWKHNGYGVAILNNNAVVDYSSVPTQG